MERERDNFLLEKSFLPDFFIFFPLEILIGLGSPFPRPCLPVFNPVILVS